MQIRQQAKVFTNSISLDGGLQVWHCKSPPHIKHDSHLEAFFLGFNRSVLLFVNCFVNQVSSSWRSHSPSAFLPSPLLETGLARLPETTSFAEKRMSTALATTSFSIGTDNS